MWAEKEIIENAFPCALANLYEAMPSLVGSKHTSKGMGSMRAEKDEDMERLQLRAESKKIILLPWFSAAVPKPAWIILLGGASLCRRSL